MYPEVVVRSHKAFIQMIRESTEAKVEVVCGTLVNEKMLEKQAYKLDLLPLKGEYKDVYIILDHEYNYSNTQ